MTSILEIQGLTKVFGGLTAVEEVNIHVGQGEIVGLIGPNGSGKTTLFNCVTGIYTADQGRIRFKGDDISTLPSPRIAQKGIARTFQLARVFKELTLYQNMISARSHVGENFLRTPLAGCGRDTRERIDYWIEFVGLMGLKGELAGEVSYGQQKLLEFAMALMAEPELILLDEPTSGVNPIMIEKVVSLTRRLHDRGKTIFVIEHNMKVVMNLCERVYVLDNGKKISEGTPAEVRQDAKVIEAYFGY